jgi:hypothetical protein
VERPTRLAEVQLATGISASNDADTVEGHVSRILAKLSAPSRGHAVDVALASGFVAPPPSAASE